VRKNWQAKPTKVERERRKIYRPSPISPLSLSPSDVGLSGGTHGLPSSIALWTSVVPNKSSPRSSSSRPSPAVVISERSPNSTAAARSSDVMSSSAGLGIDGAIVRIHDDLVAAIDGADLVGDHVFSDQAFRFVSDTSAEDDGSVIHAHREIVDVQQVVRRQTLEDQSNEAPRRSDHRCRACLRSRAPWVPCVCGSPAPTISRRSALRTNARGRGWNAGLFVQNDFACVDLTKAVPPGGAI